MSNADSVLQSILDECHEDYVGLWSVIREVRAAVADESILVQATLSLIKRLLLEGDVVAGQFHLNEFQPWEIPVEDIIGRIKHEWTKLGHEPTGGDVVWFTAKENKAAQ
jgi:hypothetical protein